MKLEISYRRIWAISAPIMLGSAVQNVIALSDSVFLFHLGQEDFAAIGFVGVFYLVIAAIGYGFSKGGQIMIARRMGEGQMHEVGRTFYAMLYFEFGLAVCMFLIMQYGCAFFFPFFINSEVVLTKSLEYLEYRSWGVFFSYGGLALIALYTGVARTRFIVVDTLVLAVVNILLNYALIFGNFGLPAMGIAGAGLASTISEVVACLLFVVYVLGIDPRARRYHLFRLPRLDWKLIRQQQAIATPVVAQSVVGVGSWFIFFSIVEDLGERPLAITNLVRIVYLILSVPCWGLASGTNTLVSNIIGQGMHDRVGEAIRKTMILCLAVTMLISIPVILAPEFFLYPLLGDADPGLVREAKPIFSILLLILAVFSFGSIQFNGLIGTGATLTGLLLQSLSAVCYLIFIYCVVHYTSGGLQLAWSAEILYWGLLGLFSYFFLKSGRWSKVSV
ncbi:MAG: MATE family efflux transporter [Saprospiraceae bacterium]|jgi:putative MATE family efflux protein